MYAQHSLGNNCVTPFREIHFIVPLLNALVSVISIASIRSIASVSSIISILSAELAPAASSLCGTIANNRQLQHP